MYRFRRVYLQASVHNRSSSNRCQENLITQPLTPNATGRLEIPHYAEISPRPENHALDSQPRSSPGLMPGSVSGPASRSLPGALFPARESRLPASDPRTGQAAPPATGQEAPPAPRAAPGGGGGARRRTRRSVRQARVPGTGGCRGVTAGRQIRGTCPPAWLCPRGSPHSTCRL